MLYRLLKSLDRSRFNSLVVSMTDKGTMGNSIEALGIPVFSLSMRRGVPNPLALWRLHSLLSVWRPAILQTWLYHADLLGLVAGKVTRVPAIAWNLRCSYWNMTQYRKLSTVVVRLLARLSSLPDAVVVNSQAGRRLHEELGYAPRRWVLIPNGFDLKEFSPDSRARVGFRQRLGLAGDALLIGLVARFDPMKDHQTFLGACKLLLKERVDVHFIFAGQGIDKTNCVLAQAVANLGIEKHVHLLGERSDIPTVMAALDIAVSSSTGEGFANVIGEAMSCGVPCVVTDVGDSAWIVGETGKIVPPKNPTAMAKALAELIKLGKEGRSQLGLAARRRIEEHFGLDSIVRRYEKLYEELVEMSDGSRAMTVGKVDENIDCPTVQGFGDEWNKFDQTMLSEDELREIFDQYFRIFPWHQLPEHAVGFDLGCGSGRWGKFVALRVGRLHCIDASEAALTVAKRSLAGLPNCEFHLASVDDLPLADNSMDFGYALGVLHHVPDTAEGIRQCVMKLKPGAPFLLYLYFAFDNRPIWYRWLWRVSNLLRRSICASPFGVKYAATQVIAALVYFPFARLSLMVEALGFNIEAFPLSAYRRRSFYTMRTDALDRFGTRLEQRFDAQEIRHMMEQAGLTQIEFSDAVPYWCAVGYKR